MRAGSQEPSFRDTAIRAAEAAGRILLRYFAGEFRVDYKGEVNLVTEADREAEATILRMIRRDFPNHGFLV